MSTEITVIYNGSCPICAREIALYRARAERTDAPIAFADLTQPGTDLHGLSADAAARRLYVVEGGRLVSGAEAFAMMWERLPGLRWLARAVRLPVARTAVSWAYETIAAPALYALHRRRERRKDRHRLAAPAEDR